MILYYFTLFLFIRHTKENSECNKLCSPCCVNVYLNEVNNSCSECPYGRFGWNCKQLCPPGYYGRLCRSICECVATECHHVTGCTTTIGTTNVQPGEGLEIEQAVNLFMDIMTTNAKQKHMQDEIELTRGNIYIEKKVVHYKWTRFSPGQEEYPTHCD